MPTNFSIPRNELSDLDVHAKALEIIGLLDGVPVSQSNAVLREARSIIEWTSVVDTNCALIRQERPIHPEAQPIPPHMSPEARALVERARAEGNEALLRELLSGRAMLPSSS